MQGILDSFSIFLIPPVLFLLTGVSLGIFSLIKTRRQYENILFALICFWYSLLMPVFISHHIFKGDIPLIMKIERCIHFFYVYIPAISVLFLHSLVHKKNRVIEAGAFVISFIISLFVFTDYYFYGMWEYRWGYIAKGGIVIQIFGLYSLSIIAYGIVLFIKKIKTDIDRYTRLKIQYIMLAILSIGLLTLGNLPALNGIDLYPPGNFAFVSILFMAWGIYRHDVIRINLYTKRRITGAIVQIVAIAGLIAVIPLCWWALENYSVNHIIGKTVPYGIPPLLSFACCVFLSFLSLRLGENRKDSITFSLLMLAYALLSIDIYLNCIVSAPEVGLRISRFSHLAVVFIPALGMHLMRSITDRHSERWLLHGNYLIGILLAFFSQTPYYLQDMHVYSWGLFAKKAPLFDVMALLSSATLFYNIGILFLAYQKSTIRFYRHRFLFLLIGSASAAVLSLGNIPAMNGYDLYPPGNFIFIPTTLFAIALFRHTIPELVRLAGSFLYYGIMAIALLASVFFLSNNHSDNRLPLYSGLIISGVLVFNYFLRRLRNVLSNLQQNKLKAAFEKLSDRLSRGRSIDEIAECISQSFFTNLASGRCAVLIQEESSGHYTGDAIRNPQNEFIPGQAAAESPSSITISADHPLLDTIHAKHSPVSQEEIEYCILNDELIVEVNDPLRQTAIILPVFIENRLSALILIGVKINGSFYSLNEIGFLYQTGINLGPHIENARILKRLEKTVEERTQKLRESEGKYRHLVENANEIIYKADWQGNFIYSNPAFHKKFGYTKDEIRHLQYLDIMTPENRDNEFAFYSGQLKNKIDESHRELPVVTKSGRILWVEQDVKSVKDETGRIVEFDAIVHDITDRKAAEDSVRESEKHYQQLMDNVSDCVFICKLDGHIRYINSAITRMTGIAQNDLIGKHFLSLVLPEYRDQQMKFYQKQVIDNIETTYCEFPVKIKNNEILWAGQTVRMIKNTEGTIEFYGITHDISNLKKADDARRDLEEAKTRFFANISHEIRTPLTLMLGPIESVLQGDYGKEIDTEFFKNLHRNTLSLLKLVNNLLDFSKIEAGKMILKVQEGDIVYFARQYLTSIRMAGASRNINLNLSATPDSILLCFDPQRMDKVFMNLLSNALKFTDPGGTVSITLLEDEDYCRIMVADTGEGIPQKSINAIFDRFSQADTTSTRKHEGTGIGLALARELVELHGGTIAVESRHIENHPDDHGSIFTVFLPKGTAHLENKSNIQFSEKSNLDEYVKDYRLIGLQEIAESQNESSLLERCESSGASSDSAAEKTILVVDDNEDMRNFLKILLQKQYRVLLAANGEEGIQCARRGRPDLIVTDVMMPVMNGFEMTSVVKNDKDLKTTPVIMLTADTELMNKVAGLENGADDYLHKPFNSMELMTRISSLLKNYEYQQIISRRNADIESELEVARLLQQRLLPSSMPEISGYLEHAIYIPMDKIGGDFYDIENRDGFLNLFIADVSGHGLPGAFLATVTKIALENITSRTAANKVLYLLNNVILQHTVQSNFVTAFFTMIDITTNVMRYASAGHIPPILYRKKNDEFIELMTKGTPLGWFNDIRIEEKTVQLETGDRVIFYTDGITECRGISDDLFGEESLYKAIRESSENPSEEFSKMLMEKLKAFKGDDSFDDDITMVVLDVM